MVLNFIIGAILWSALGLCTAVVVSKQTTWRVVACYTRSHWHQVAVHLGTLTVAGCLAYWDFGPESQSWDLKPALLGGCVFFITVLFSASNTATRQSVQRSGWSKGIALDPPCKAPSSAAQAPSRLARYVANACVESAEDARRVVPELYFKSLALARRSARCDGAMWEALSHRNVVGSVLAYLPRPRPIVDVALRRAARYRTASYEPLLELHTPSTSEYMPPRGRLDAGTSCTVHTMMTGTRVWLTDDMRAGQETSVDLEVVRIRAADAARLRTRHHRTTSLRTPDCEGDCSFPRVVRISVATAAGFNTEVRVQELLIVERRYTSLSSELRPTSTRRVRHTLTSVTLDAPWDPAWEQTAPNVVTVAGQVVRCKPQAGVVTIYDEISASALSPPAVTPVHSRFIERRRAGGGVLAVDTTLSACAQQRKRGGGGGGEGGSNEEGVKRDFHVVVGKTLVPWGDWGTCEYTTSLEPRHYSPHVFEVTTDAVAFRVTIYHNGQVFDASASQAGLAIFRVEGGYA